MSDQYCINTHLTWWTQTSNIYVNFIQTEKITVQQKKFESRCLISGQLIVYTENRQMLKTRQKTLDLKDVLHAE